jgi:RNase H-fold protein (predicted Holliday junction resolvase)
MLLDRFGKEHHELLICQLFHIKQLNGVAEYLEKFSELVDQLTAYETTTDPLYYTMRFVDGLKEELRAGVLVQRPRDVDTDCVLALLQEEVVEHTKKEYRRLDYFSASRVIPKTALPLPVPPRLDKSPAAPSAKERHVVDTSRGRSSDEKLSTLRAYRRAKGLCVKCAEKWHRDHKCPDSVQLHVLQEVFDLEYRGRGT